MLDSKNKLIKNKVSFLNLVKKLSNISKEYKSMGF